MAEPRMAGPDTRCVAAVLGGGQVLALFGRMGLQQHVWSCFDGKQVFVCVCVSE